MLKTLELLSNITGNRKLGNYRKEYVDNNGQYYEVYYYHENPIFMIDYNNSEITISNCGWFTPSTTRAINSLIDLYEGYFHLGYKVIDPIGYSDKRLKYNK